MRGGRGWNAGDVAGRPGAWVGGPPVDRARLAVRLKYAPVTFRDGPCRCRHRTTRVIFAGPSLLVPPEPILVTDSAARGIRSAQIGMLINAILAAVKLVAGIVGNAYALIADAIES